MAALEGEITSVATEMKGMVFDFQDEKKNLLASLRQELDRGKTMLMQVVLDARSEFDEVRANIQGLFTETGKAFGNVQAKVTDLETKIRDHTQGGRYSYLPLKTMAPTKFEGKDEMWRKWQDNMADYFDMQNGGMKAFLKSVEVDAEALTDVWLEGKRAAYPAAIVDDQVRVYRALKALTDGEAHLIVQAVKDEDGFKAWKALHQRYGLSIAAKQAKAMADVTSMVTQPARTPTETRSKITELDRRVRIAEEATGQTLDNLFSKSVLAGFMDPTTRAHTSQFQGAASTYQQLRAAVMEFVGINSSAAKQESNAMDIGRLSGQEEWSMHSAEDGDAEDDQWQQLAAVKPTTQCHRCGGFGHVAAQCATIKGQGKGTPTQETSSKGKGKGPGKGGKTGGKAKGKGGPKGGCWHCGGAHYADSCPYGKGIGKNNSKGFNHIGSWPMPGEIKSLCTVRAVHKPTVTHNRFSALQEEGIIEQSSPRPATLGDYIKAKFSEHAKKQTGGSLRGLETIEPEGVMTVAEAEWEEIEFAVDSGASETVVSDTMLNSVPTVPNAASRRGVMYEVANGERIANLGEKQIRGFTDGEGLQRRITAQVCDVNKPLMSVSKLVQAGNTVVFSPGGAYIEDEAQQKIWLREQGGMYMAKMWVPTKPEQAGF